MIGCYYCEMVAGGPEVKPCCPLHDQPAVGFATFGFGSGASLVPALSEQLSVLPASVVGSIGGGGDHDPMA